MFSKQVANSPFFPELSIGGPIKAVEDTVWNTGKGGDPWAVDIVGMAGMDGRERGERSCSQGSRVLRMKGSIHDMTLKLDVEEKEPPGRPNPVRLS